MTNADITRTVRDAIAKETRVPEDQLREDEPLESYGVESLMAVAIVRRLEETFGELSKSLLFEYQTLAGLLEYFTEEFEGIAADESRALRDTAGPAEVQASRVAAEGAQPPTEDPQHPSLLNASRATESRESEIERLCQDDIAIIGISGRFPQARDLGEFWKNISEGRDCITEIPGRLWDWREYWHPDRGVPGKSYSKWGGFIEDSDCFDPLFFNISNLAAEGMDPQERVFLESVQHTLEDAGYSRESLRGKRVGLWVSAMWGPYQHYGARDACTDSSFASISNRASYFFDLRGPSLTLDTTCSGSLTTLHLACESLRTGETEAAIAGGVNITSHPHKYLVLSRTGFASTDGRCRSFGADADGYVPGDGVGAVLLKLLRQAQADGDRIYAVIKATAINHGGRSSGFTVPSAEAQASLIESALHKAQIDPRTITYVEAHAPGTALGDPIEVRGLTNAFRKHTEDTGFCAIGSVKSNIGHLESAAGFASLAKVVLQMQHQQLVPSIHSDKLNPNIQFDRTPFYLQRQLVPWIPCVHEHGKDTRIPRRASVSAFGAGGSNAHVILEEYVAPMSQRIADVPTEHLVVLSAKTKERLGEAARNLVHFVEAQIGDPERRTTGRPQTPTAEAVLERVSDTTRVRVALLDTEDHLKDLVRGGAGLRALADQLRIDFGVDFDAQSLEMLTLGSLIAAVEKRASANGQSGVASSSATLESLAYTLQVGREAMQYRLATLVQTVPQLRQRLDDYLTGGAEVEQTWTGKVTNVAANITGRAEEEEYIARLVASRRHERLGRLWCSGVTIPWNDLYGDPKPQRIGLPLYPFARERCWIERPAFSGAQTAWPVAVAAVSAAETSKRTAPTATVGPEAPEDIEVERLVYRPHWSPLPGQPASVSIETKSQLLVYPQPAGSLIGALKKLLPVGDTYEVVLGTRTQLLADRRWEVDVSEEAALAACLDFVGDVREVYFFGGCHASDWQPTTKQSFDSLQAQSVIALFRLVKALRSPERLGRTAPKLKVVVNGATVVQADEQVQPFTSAVLGFARSVAREFPQLQTEIIDIDVPQREGARAASVQAALHYVIGGAGGQREFAVRAGQPYVRQLLPYDLPKNPRPIFKEKGLYLLIGGAGQVGSRLSAHLAQTVSARLVWVGRRPCDDAIRNEIVAIERLGGEVSYFAADAADSDALAEVTRAVERDHGEIDGVLHMAMVHEVSRIQDLTEAQVRRALAAKVESTYALYSSLRHRKVGFVALFSSAEAYVGNTGWAAYAGSCSFQDVFAQYWAREASFPVLSLNWGYWEGAPADVAQMLAAKGVHSLSTAQGAEILERALTCQTAPLIALNVEDHVLERMGIVPRKALRQNGHSTRGRAEQIGEPAPPVTQSGAVEPHAASVPTVAEPLPPHAAVTEGLINLLSAVLKIDRARLDSDTDLINYGVDSLTVIALHKTLEDKAGALPATLFVTLPTIRAVATRLISQYPAAARAVAGDGVTKRPEAAQSEPVNSPAPSSDRNHLTLLRQVNGSAIARYLREYGGLFRDKQLAEGARPAPLQALKRVAATGEQLTHVLIDTPSARCVEVLASGTGIPVLLLPAVGLTGPTWRNQITSTLAERMRFFVAHPPGYGLTKPITDCTTRGVAEVLKDVIDVVSMGRRVHLVASCLGCVAATYLGRFFPERVASLTLVGAFHNTAEMVVGDPERLTTDEFSHMLLTAVERVKDDFAAVTRLEGDGRHGGSRGQDEELALLLNSLCANSLIAMRYLSEMLSLSVLDWLPGIEAPTQCIYGTNDKIVGPHHSRTIAAAIPNARLFAVEGAGHFPYLTHSEQFNVLLETFVLEHDAPRTELVNAAAH